jgi:hypothetical protein
LERNEISNCNTSESVDVLYQSPGVVACIKAPYDVGSKMFALFCPTITVWLTAETTETRAEAAKTRDVKICMLKIFLSFQR